MGKHDGKFKKIQVDVIDNKDDDLDFIEVRKKLQGSEEFDTSDPKDYVQRKDLDGVAAGLRVIRYANLEADHKTYINTDLAEQTFQLFQNGINRFLDATEFSIDPDGGFELVNELADGDALYLIGAIAGNDEPALDQDSYATYALMIADGTPPDRMRICRVLVDENKSFNNTIYYWYPDNKRLWIAATEDN